MRTYLLLIGEKFSSTSLAKLYAEPYFVFSSGGKTFTNKTTADGLGSNNTFETYLDEDGAIYVATNFGLSISTDGGSTFTNKTTADGLATINLYGLFIDL